MIGAAAIAALAHHPIQPTGGQRRELLQRLADERQIGVDLRRPRRRADPAAARPAPARAHHAVVHVQLTGDGADAPLLDVIVAQDLRLDVRRRDHARVLSGRVASRSRRPSAAAQEPRRTNAGQRRPHQWQCEAVRRGRSSGTGCVARRSPASRAAADHPAAARVNRDASLSCRAPDSGASDRHARAAPGGWSGNAVRPHAARGAGPVRRSLRHSRSGRDRSSCRSRSGRGSRRTETAGLTSLVHARTGRRHVDERHDCRDIGPACVPSTVWGTASMRNRQVRLGAVLAPQGRNATPPLVAASGRARPAAPHRSRRHVVTYPAIADMPLRQRFPAADITPPIQALRARYARVRAAIDSNG